MNVLSSYLRSSRSSLRSVLTTRAKPQLANVAFFVLSRTLCHQFASITPARGWYVGESSRRRILNKPPLLSLGISADGGRIEMSAGRHAADTYKIECDDGIEARASAFATAAAARIARAHLIAKCQRMSIIFNPNPRAPSTTVILNLVMDTTRIPSHPL